MIYLLSHRFYQETDVIKIFLKSGYSVHGRAQTDNKGRSAMPALWHRPDRISVVTDPGNYFLGNTQHV